MGDKSKEKSKNWNESFAQLAAQQQALQGQTALLKYGTQYAYGAPSQWPTTSATSNFYYTTSGDSNPSTPAKPAAPVEENPLEWLDRRVQEMRVAL